MNDADTIQLKDEDIYPSDSILKSVLGSSFEVYQRLCDLYSQYELSSEWRYYKDGKAWLCKVQKKKKTIVWMSVWSGYLQATMYFPLRLVDQVLELDLHPEIKKHILKTKNVGRSKPCTFKIQESTLLGDFEKVMQFKIKSK